MAFICFSLLKQSIDCMYSLNLIKMHGESCVLQKWFRSQSDWKSREGLLSISKLKLIFKCFVAQAFQEIAFYSWGYAGFVVKESINVVHYFGKTWHLTSGRKTRTLFLLTSNTLVTTGLWCSGQQLGIKFPMCNIFFLAWFFILSAQET